MNPDQTCTVSVVVATYNRLQLLQQLLDDLAEQDLAPTAFEVIVVDDGSTVPVRPALEATARAYSLRVLEQANAGQAAARDRGVREARGEIVVIVDDDMRVPPSFLREHKAVHDAGFTLVLGHIRPAPELDTMPLFERFHAQQLDAFVRSVREGAPVRGAGLCTGNVSFRRRDYLTIGGFDRTLQRSEDRDLGIRLESAGAKITFSEGAYTVHRSDHVDLDVWLGRARLYGKCDSLIASKHAQIEYVDPWRFIFAVSPVSRPLLLMVTVAPALGTPLSRSAMKISRLVDGLGLARLAIAGTTFSYGIEYFTGMREHAGSLRSSVTSFARYLRKRQRRTSVQAG